MAHVLLIEDDAGIRTAVVRALHSRGHAVDSAGTGLDGLQSMLTGSPDAVVLDLGLPDVDGRGICAHPSASVAALRSALDLIGGDR